MDLLSLFSKKPSSKEVANERLKLILIHDRADLSPELLDLIKGEIMNVIAKYVEVDNSDVEVKFTKVAAEEGSSPALVANIPIKRMKAKR
jgi:cell division topological specificity factor